MCNNHFEGGHDDCGCNSWKAEIGLPVPPITMKALHNDQELQLNLKEYQGKWLILFFYPADFTFVCPTELMELAASYEEFQKENAEIISISTDTIYAHKAWRDMSGSIKKINFPMASDPTGGVCQIFGTYMEEEGISLRGTFLIDPKGILRTIEIHDNSIGRSSAELLRKLRAAIFVEAHGGEVCPASWKPGEKTLKPGMDLVGKI